MLHAILSCKSNWKPESANPLRPVSKAVEGLLGVTHDIGSNDKEAISRAMHVNDSFQRSKESLGLESLGKAFIVHPISETVKPGHCGGSPWCQE